MIYRQGDGAVLFIFISLRDIAQCLKLVSFPTFTVSILLLQGTLNLNVGEIQVGLGPLETGLLQSPCPQGTRPPTQKHSALHQEARSCPGF